MDLSQLNDDQRATLKQLREAVKDCKLPQSDDVYLLRWLVAREFDLAKSEKMLRNSMEWRQKNRVDTITEDWKAPEVLTKYCAVGHVGADKNKSYVVVCRHGAMDWKGLLLSAKKKDLITYMVKIVEQSILDARKNPARFIPSPTTISQATIILDMDGFSMRHITHKPALDTVLQLLQMNEANYPEFLRRIFVINAPKVFSIMYSLAKPFMHEKTRKKVHIYSHDAEQWKAALLEDFDPQELPACYGGTLTDPDGNPYCITMVNLGGEVPKSYYLPRNFDTTNKNCLPVCHGSREQLEFRINEAGVHLKWDFHSEEGDISFAIYRKEDGQMIPVVPHERVDCHVSPEEGEICCGSTGAYVVEFDNSFSYFRSKKIWYSITIETNKPNC
ncbi:SEC14-like protein 2 [Daphnia carinata]|uniref:SEC14-like protein 2 n=1 Tax=Daphnia carinata TaxID=120202 RepID=UPI00257B8A04|nr:SEC14-like protein 2 [Daphnia carinata]